MQMSSNHIEIDTAITKTAAVATTTTAVSVSIEVPIETLRQTHAWKRDIIERYRKLQEEFKAKKDNQKPLTNNDLSAFDNVQMQNLDETEPLALPKLKQFKKDYASTDKIPAIYKTMNCSFLEKALFYAIQSGTQTGDLELLDELLDALPLSLTVDVNCIIEIAQMFDTSPIKLSPLFVSLLNWDSYINNWDLSIDSSFPSQWASKEAAYRNRVIQKLIRSGATIDDPNHLGASSGGATFLDLFVLKALDHQELSETLFFILQEAKAFQVNLSLMSGRNYTLLHSVMMTLISRTKMRQIINYQVFEDTIRILIQSTRQDYSKTIQDDSVFTSNQRTLLDIYHYNRVSNDEDTNKQPHFQIMFNLFNIIFDDMATQCLEDAALLQLKEYPRIIEKLTAYAKKQFIHDKNSYKLDDNKIDGEAIVVTHTIVRRAIRQINEHCALGFALRDCADYLPIQVQTNILCKNEEISPWYIVTSYCLNPLQPYYKISLSFFNLGYQAAPDCEYDPKNKTFIDRTVSTTTTATSVTGNQPVVLLSAASKNTVGMSGSSLNTSKPLLGSSPSAPSETASSILEQTSGSNPIPLAKNDSSAIKTATKPTGTHMH